MSLFAIRQLRSEAERLAARKGPNLVLLEPGARFVLEVTTSWGLFASREHRIMTLLLAAEIIERSDF